MSRLFNAKGALAGAGLLAVATVGGYEGLRLYSYPDIVGVWTGCYGETKGMKPGLKFTKEQCDVTLITSLVEHEGGMRDCLADPDALPDKVYVAFLSTTYNIGVTAFCKSTIARKANDNDLAGACDAILMFDKAGGRVVAGLSKRRQAERKLCREGLS